MPTLISAACIPRRSFMPCGSCAGNEDHCSGAERGQSELRRRTARDPRRFSPRALRADRNTFGLRARCMRRMHDRAGRTGDALMLAARGNVRRAIDPVTALLRRHFHTCHAVQCGFCTPGMLITARDILRRVRCPSEQSVRHELSGQICRCTGYANIVKAIVAAGQEFSTEVMAQPMQGREHG
jgi:hypothetical protein